MTEVLVQAKMAAQSRRHGRNWNVLSQRSHCR
jgi:hypothetical protein